MRRIHHIAVALALAATLLRALLPEGWMPNPAGVAGTPVVLCTMYGMEHIVLDADGNPAKPQDSKHSEVCPFAASAHLAPPAVQAAIAAPSQTANAAKLLPMREAQPSRVLRHAINPRAPPSLA
jgi:hypothetical protein